MDMRKNLVDVYNTLNKDETLLRLLHYKPTNFLDDPLDKKKQDILKLPSEEKWNVIRNVLIPGMKVDDLETSQKCRVMLFMGDRDGMHNDEYSSQSVTIDILIGTTIDNIDFRLAWVCDRINKLLHKNNITGLSKLRFKNGRPFNAPHGYVGYRLLYKFEDFQ